MVLSSFAACHICGSGLYLFGLLNSVFTIPERSLEFRLDQSVGIAFSLVNYVDLLGLGVKEYVECMSEKFHLYTCLFGIHRFHSKSFNFDNLYFII